MSLAKNWDRLSLANASPGTHLPIQAALAELSADEQEPQGLPAADPDDPSLDDPRCVSLRKANEHLRAQADDLVARGDEYTLADLKAITDIAEECKQHAHAVVIDAMTNLGDLINSQKK
jgi:hypothetical protein